MLCIHMATVLVCMEQETLKTYKFLYEFKVREEHVGFMKVVVFVWNFKKMVFQFERVVNILKAKVSE